ncbi:MAG: hypothetical protein NTV43_02695 [Methylococcales bacterium]|nr:hypothetical protein [Methylococcales bacterium]
MANNSFLKWTGLVWLNAAFSFWVALGEYPLLADRLAIVLGVFSFVLFYTKLDGYLVRNKQQRLHKALLISTVVKSLVQFYPGVELFTGIAATAFVDWLLGKVVFVSAYCITLVDGLLLSLLVAAMTGVLNFVMKRRQLKKTI